MTAQELKNSILQLAIQGKLVKQDPNDEPASVLLEKIKEEKEELIKEKKIKRGKYSEIYKDSSDNHYYEKFEDGTVNDITDEIPFEIPNNWCWTRLYNIGETNIGLTYKPSDVSKDGTIVLRSSNIQNGKIDYKDIIKVNIDIPESKKCHKNDILICARNGSKKLVGKSALIDSDDLTFGAFMAIYRSPLNQYIYLILNSSYFRNSVIGEVGTTTINQLTQPMIKNFLVPIPPINEQMKIVEKIQKLFPYIAQFNEKHEKLKLLNSSYKEKLKKSILQYAIQGKLVSQNLNAEPAEVLINKILKEKRGLIKSKQIKKENLSVIYKDNTDNQFYEKFDDGTIINITDEIPFDIPNSWRWIRLNNIVKSINAGGDKPKIFTKNITDKNTIPVISNGEKNEGIFGYTDKPVVFEKSLTISGRGTIGYSKIRTIPYVPIVRLLVLVPLINTNLEYLQLSIQALIERGVGTAVKQLTVPMIKPKLIPIPPLAEQEKILKIFNKFIETIEK